MLPPLRLCMEAVRSNFAPSPPHLESPIAAHESKTIRKLAAITLIAIGILFLAGAVAFGLAAPLSGIHLLWIGVPSCLLAAILAFGALLCTVKSSRRNEWTFMRTPQPMRTPVIAPGDYEPGVYDRGVINRIRARRQQQQPV